MKKIIAMLLLACLVLSFAACGGDSGTTTTTAKTAKSSVATRDPGPIDTNPDDEQITDLYIVYGSAVIDGVKGDEWDNAVGVTLDKAVKDNAAADTVVTAYAMWDTNGLYFLFDIVDSTISQQAAPGDYNSDGIYLYISETMDYSATSMGSYTNGNYQMAFINDDLSMVPRNGDKDLIADEDYQLVFNQHEGGLTIEFHYMPKHVELKDGIQMFMDFQYNDCANGSRLGCIKWFDDKDGNGNMQDFGFVTLLKEGETAPVE